MKAKTFLNLKLGQQIKCKAEDSRSTIVGKVSEVGEKEATLAFRDNIFINIGSNSDITRNGSTLVFHG